MMDKLKEDQLSSSANDQIRFIDGKKKGTKVLVFENHTFHVDRKTGEWTTFKCYNGKGRDCRARVRVHGLNPEDHTFDRFEVIWGKHRKHLPSTKKCQRMKGQAPQKDVEIISEIVKEEPCHSHICLFCCDNLPEGYRNVVYLETLVPAYHGGDTLRISLNDPVKNSEAFELLCNRLGVNWSRPSSFNHEVALPLCSKCQDLYQQMFQLNLQIGELEKLIERHAGVIRKTIKRSEQTKRAKEEEATGGDSIQLSLLGLDTWRESVLDLASPEINYDIVKKEPEVEDPSQKSWSDLHNDNDDFGDDDHHQPDIELDQSPGSPPLSKAALRNQRRNEQARRRRLQKRLRSGIQYHKHPCHLCPAVLLGQVAMMDHYKTVHPEEHRFTCKFCKRHFRVRQHCIQHQLKHTGERPYGCPHCPKFFRHQSSLSAHQRSHHRNVTLDHKCPTCGKGYVSRSTLNAHMVVHNKESVVLCKVCGKSFKHRISFLKHNSRFHSGQAGHSEPVKEVEPPSEQVLESLGIPPEIPEPSRQKCHLCWTPVLGRTLLDKHFQDKHPDHPGGPNTCRCGESFKQYTMCYQHALRHSDANRGYQCDQCPRAFFTVSQLRDHIQRHVPLEERRKYVCDICGVRVTTSSHLAKHKRRHDGGEQERWVCETCGKSYVEKKGLAHHTRTVHLKIRNHKCDQCGKAFAVRAEFVKHLRTHTDLKPFSCGICGKALRHKGTLRRHVRVQHGEGGSGGGKKKKVQKVNKKKKKDMTAGVEGGDGGGQAGAIREGTVDATLSFENLTEENIEID